MTLKYKLENLDGLDEAVKALYKQDGDSFVLDVDGVEGKDDVQALKDALQRQKESAAKSRADADEAIKATGKAEREKLLADGKHEELAASLQRENDALKATAAQEKSDRLATDLQSKADTLGAKAGVDANAAKMLAMAFKASLSHDESGVLKGPKGETPDELYSAFEESGEYELLWKGSGANGGGENGGSGSGRKVLKDMSDSERLEFKAKDPNGFAAELNR